MGGSTGLVGSGGDAGRGGSDAGQAGAGGVTPDAGGPGGSDGSSTGTGGGPNTGGSSPGTGSAGAGDAGVGTGAATSDGGGAGGSKAPCVYAGGSMVPGCETLASNPGFAANSTGWKTEVSDVTTAWHAGDAQADPSSGSLAVTYTSTTSNIDGLGMAGGTQCIQAVVAGASYDFAAGLFTGGGQGMGGGALSVFFHDTADCTGPLTKGAVSPTESAVDSWHSVALQAAAPASTKSMLVRLAVVKPFRQASLTVRFDNVLVQRTRQ